MADFENIVKNHSEGLSETAINALVSAIKTAVGNEYVDKERYKAKLSEIDLLKEKQQTAEDDATTASKWKDKYDGLKAEFEKFKGDVKAKETQELKEKAYRDALKDANLTEKGVEKALKYADWGTVELDDDGKLKDAKSHIKAVREEWAEYVNKTGQQGAYTATPPSRGSGNGGITKDDIMKIEDTTERQKAIAENHELFGF